MLFRKLFEKSSERYRRQDAIWKEIAKRQAEYNDRKRMDFEKLPEESREKIYEFKLVITVWFLLIVILSIINWKISLIFTFLASLCWFIFFIKNKKLILINIFPVAMALIFVFIINMSSITSFVQKFIDSIKISETVSVQSENNNEENLIIKEIEQ